MQGEKIYIGKSKLSEQDVLNALKEVESAPEAVIEKDVAQWEPSEVKNCRDLLQEMVSAGKAVGHPFSCGLRAIEQTKYTEQLRIYSSKSLILYKDALLQVQEKIGKICDLLHLELPKEEQDLERIAKFCAIMIESKHIPASWVFSPAFPGLIGEIEQLVEAGRSMEKYREQLLNKWSPSVMEIDGIMFWEDWEKSHRKGFFKRKHNETAMQKRLSPYAKVAVDQEDISLCLQNLSAYQQQENKIRSIVNRYGAELRGFYQNENTNLMAMDVYLSRAKRMNEELCSIDGYPMLRCMRQEDIRELQVFFGTWRTFSEVQGAVNRLFAVNREKLERGEHYLETDIKMCETWCAEIHKLKDWVHFNAAAAQAYACGLGSFVQLYQEGAEHDQIVPSFDRAYYSALLKACERKNEQPKTAI